MERYFNRVSNFLLLTTVQVHKCDRHIYIYIYIYMYNHSVDLLLLNTVQAHKCDRVQALRRLAASIERDETLACEVSILYF